MIAQNCFVIAVTGGKGGVGKSVFAANLAAALTKEMRSPVLLMDLDSKSCGDQNVITGLRPNKTVWELTQSQVAVTAQNLATMLTPHPGGFHYIGAVRGPDEVLHAASEGIRKLLYSVSQQFRYIVVDLGTDLTDLQMGVIAEATCVIAVATPEILTVNQTRRLLNDLITATVPLDFMQLVLNKVSKSTLDPRAISESLRLPIIGLIPQDDNAAYQALQRSQPFVLSPSGSTLTQAYIEIVRALTGGVLQRLKSLSKPTQLKAPTSPATVGAPQLMGKDGPAPVGSNPNNQLKLQIHHDLIKEMDLKKDLHQTKGDPNKEKELKSKTVRVISQLVDRYGQHLAREERSRVVKEVTDEALGLGPLEDLLSDAKVTEIMVNGHEQIYVERDGKLTLSQVTFTSNLQLRNVIERIVTPLGRRIDEKTPYVDARLADGSRVNAIIEPLAIDGPALTIRKFPAERITIDDYVDRFGSLTKPMADFLRICVEQGLNVVISGGTGSGKTTLLNVLSSFIPTNERIITVEDAAELQLKQEHVVRLETRPSNMEGSGEISIRDLIKNSLRMRPDRIVVGECRDGAALDMLSAMNTGHDGSMTTVHANSPREAISRLETLCLMAGMELPAKAIRDQIASAVNLIVQIGRLSDGSRKIKSITEVAGMQGEAVTLQEIFRFKEEGFDKNRKIVGQFQAMGLIPTFIEDFERRGVHIPRHLFTTNSSAEQPTSPNQSLKPVQPKAGIKSPPNFNFMKPAPPKKTGSES